MGTSKPKPPAHVEWAKHLREKVPGDTIRAIRHHHDTEERSIDIFISENSEGSVAATIGIMDYDQSAGGGEPLATEVVVDARGPVPYVSNVAATIAFYIMREGWKVRPDNTFLDVIELYAPKLQVRHVLFVPPYQWEDGMTRVTLSDRTIYPLLAVPITDGELDLIERDGAAALTGLWERSSTDMLDWTREGVV